MTVLKFNEEQETAIALAVQWYRDYQDGKPVRQFFALGGYAGTGKTSVARHISQLCCSPARVKYIAPTGKAAARLRDKGCAGAGTVHKFLYNYLGSSFTDDPEFEVKATLDEQPLLIVCDEASMIGRRMGRDILSKKIPVIFLGDLGQVEPVNDEPFLSANDFDYNLEKIERNGGNIVRASFYVRTGGRLPPREYEDVKVYERRHTMNDIEKHVSEDGVMLSSYNSTRQLLNEKARIVLGYNESRMPVIGEKVICTFNQHSYAIANGEQFVLQDMRNLHDHEFGDTDDEFMMMATLRSITNDEVKQAKFYTGCFLGADEQERNSSMRRPGGFDFGYALTIHKAQGSEWQNVMLMEEFMRGAAYHRLMYTGITRAISHLTVFRSK